MRRMLTIRWLLVALGACAVLLVGGATLFARSRLSACKPVPPLAGELLPHADLAPQGSTRMPAGWGRATARGVELRGKAIDPQHPATWGFDLDGDGRALQLIGIANYVETPPIAVQPGTSYCFVGRALTDSDKQSATRLHVAFRWLDAQNKALAADASGWQPVALWNKSRTDWSTIRAAFTAPPAAATLVIRLQPASDDRVYLDVMHVQRTIDAQASSIKHQASGVTQNAGIVAQPWPSGARGAVAFTFDWETEMGGLIHSRSLGDDPNAAQVPEQRGLAMRQGVTTTLDLFRPFAIRATYYATGYNFLAGNAEQRQFMGNPTFAWATKAAGWQLDWSKRPWFGDDPHATAQTQPGWYFGDLIAPLQREHQDIQSHTFSHLYGGLASAAEWRADFGAWRDVAAARNVAAARSLAFPWSGSGGMSDANWRELEHAGITSVTRTSWSLEQSDLFGRDKRGVPSTFDCRAVPGHESILACPDFYMHNQQTADEARALIDQAIAQGGMIDLWAHTEEVVSPAQIAAWVSAVRYAAQRRDAGELWVAPLTEIADWQHGVAALRIAPIAAGNQTENTPLTFTVTNASAYTMDGLTLKLPFKPQKITVNGQPLNTQAMILDSQFILPHLAAGTQAEVRAWPAS